jgi:hypothetical protein
MEIEIPNMDCADIFAETGKRAIMRYQMDGAEPQPEYKLLDAINWEFDKSAVWILKSCHPIRRRMSWTVYLPSNVESCDNKQGLKNSSLVIDRKRSGPMLRRFTWGARLADCPVLKSSPGYKRGCGRSWRRCFRSEALHFTMS